MLITFFAFSFQEAESRLRQSYGIRKMEPLIDEEAETADQGQVGPVIEEVLGDSASVRSGYSAANKEMANKDMVKMEVRKQEPIRMGFKQT